MEDLTLTRKSWNQHLQAQHTSGDAPAEKREASPFIMQKKGEPMTEKRTPDFTFAQRLGNTNFKVNVYCKDDSDVTYVFS